MKKDKNGVEIKTGDVCFYSERPHSNYADSIVEIYEVDGVQRMGTLVVNGLSQTEYVECGRRGDDVELRFASFRSAQETDICEGLEVLEGVELDDVSIEFADKRFPLEKAND